MAIEAGTDPFTLPFRSTTPPNWFTDKDRKARAIWAADPDTWDFWLRWWDGVLSGQQLDWELQKQFALIPEEVWTQGPAAVAEAILGIEGKFDSRKQILQSDLMRAALADFSFDAMQNLMRMVPFQEDIKNLRDPVTLQRFLDDSADVRDALEDFCGAAEAGGRQAAREVRHYADKDLTELSTARQVEHLRVGNLIRLGSTLHDYSLNEGTRAGLGEVLPRQLDKIVTQLLDLTRAYFAPGLVRLRPLEDIRLLQTDDPSRILGHLRRNLEAVRKVRAGQAIPLDDEDIAVLADVIAELERMRGAYDSTLDAQEKERIGTQIAQRSTQAGVTFGRYWLRATEKARKVGDGVDLILKWQKRGKGVEGLMRFVKELWEKLV